MIHQIVISFDDEKERDAIFDRLFGKGDILMQELRELRRGEHFNKVTFPKGSRYQFRDI